MLKHNPFYHPTTIYGKIYLIPYGQKAAEQAPAYEINQTGLWIWNHLDQIQQNAMTDDQLSFIRQLQAEGLLEEGFFTKTEEPIQEPANAACDAGSKAKIWKTLRLADLHIQLRGSAAFFSKSFLPFAASSDELESASGEMPDQRITVTYSDRDHTAGARLVIQDSQLCVLDGNNVWILIYPTFRNVWEAVIDKDGRTAQIFLHQNLKKKDTSNLRFEVFHAIRIPFLLLAQRRGYGVLHSASIRYRNKAWLFSAPSGTGKTTHVKFWEKAGWADILNGDLNLIGIKNHQSYVFGIPWCGTSGIATTETVPLGGIYLLKRARQNRICTLPADQALLRTSQRLITPVWTEEMLNQNLNFCKNLTERILIRELQCTPTAEAAAMVKHQIDTDRAD